MPLTAFQPGELAQAGMAGIDLRAQEVVGPSFGDTIGAALRQENIVGSFFADRMRGIDRFQKEDGFTGDALWSEIKGTRYERHWDRFSDVFNRPAFMALKSQIDMEDDDRRTLDASGFLGDVASVGAAVFDLPTLLPGGAVFRGARGGVSVARTTLAGGAAGVLDAGVSEFALQATQETRSGQQTAIGIGAGALFGGLIGTAAGTVMSSVERRAALTLLDRARQQGDISDSALAEFRAGAEEAQSAGAAAVRRTTTLEDFGIAGTSARAVGRATAGLNPVLRAAHSPSVEHRNIMANLQETGFAMTMNTRGDGVVAAETATKFWERGALAAATEQHNALYRQGRQSGMQMSRSEFNDAVGRAMRRNDTGDNEWITKSAQVWRSKLIDPLKDEAIGVKLLDEGVSVTTAPSYFSRVYRTKQIIAEETEFKRITRKWLDSQLQAVEEAAARGARDGKKPPPDFVSAADRQDYIDGVADEIFDKITGRLGIVEPAYRIASTERGPLKERTFSIPDALIEKYLESDVEMIGRRYARIMSADVELARVDSRLGGKGDPTLQSQIDKVRADYNKLRAAAKTEKERLDLKSREDSDVSDIAAIRDLLRGQYKAGGEGSALQRGTRAIMTFNYLRSMGGVMFANLTEVARPAMVHGLGRFMAEGLAPMATNLKALNLSVRDLKLLGGVTERTLLSRISDMAELADPYASTSPFERFLDNVASVFTRATLLPFLNDFNRSVSGTLTQNRILKNVGKAYTDLPQKERTYMGFVGINEDMAQRINKMYAKFGQLDGNVRIANIEQWTDKQALQAYAGAVNKDLDGTIVVKGKGDVPLVLQTPVGKAIAQFKSYAMASHQRVLMRGLQDGPASIITGMVAMSAIGSLVYMVKQLESGREISDNPGTIIAEGLDRTGIFALAFEVNNAVEKLGAGGIYSLAAMPFDDGGNPQKASRFASRNLVDSLAGPTFGLFKDVTSLASALAPATKGEEVDFTPGDISTVRKLAPGASLPYWRWLIDQIVVPDLKERVE